MFHQRIIGDEIEEEDEEEEDEEEEEEEEEEEVEEEGPSSQYIQEKLATRGITLNDIIKHVLYQEHSSFGHSYEQYELRSSEVYGQFRSVITQYRSQAATAQRQREAREAREAQRQIKAREAREAREASNNVLEELINKIESN